MWRKGGRCGGREEEVWRKGGGSVEEGRRKGGGCGRRRCGGREEEVWRKGGGVEEKGGGGVGEGRRRCGGEGRRRCGGREEEVWRKGGGGGRSGEEEVGGGVECEGLIQQQQQSVSRNFKATKSRCLSCVMRETRVPDKWECLVLKGPLTEGQQAD